jgi:predicted amidohydrolase
MRLAIGSPWRAIPTVLPRALVSWWWLVLCLSVPVQGRTLRVAIGQIFCLDGAKEGNFARIEHAMQEARDQGADLIVFPECSLLGWVNPDAHRLACPIPGPDSDRLGALARKYHLYVAVGLAEKDGDRLFDSAILLDDEGNILLKHRKLNILTSLMDPPYTPGDQVAAVDTKWGRLGMIICADCWGEGVVDRMKARKPGLLLIPFGWAAKEEEWPEHGKKLEDLVRKLGKTLECPVVGVDLVGEIAHGPWTGRTYGGQSLAVDGDGAVLARCADRDREVKVVALTVNPGG